MRDRVKEYKADNLTMALVSIAVGAVLIVFSGPILKMIGYLVSVALFLMGAASVISYFRRPPEDNFMNNDFLRGLVEIVLGVCALIRVKIVIDFLPMVFGIVVIISGCKKLQEAIDMARVKDKSWIAFIVIAAINIGLGVVVVCNPFDTARILMIFIGAGLIFGGIMDFVITMYVSKQLGEGGPKPPIDVDGPNF